MSTQGITKVTQTIGSTIAKNSPTILTGVSVAGLLATTIMAVKATPKAIRILEDERYERSHSNGPATDVLTKKEILKLTWKCYIPSAIMGAVTIGCIIGGNSISMKRNAALAGAYSLTEAALKEYQAKVVEKIGEAKHREIKDDIAKEKIERNPVSKSEVIVTGMGETLCLDAFSGRYFKSDMETIKRALNKLSRDLMTDMFVPLNSVYSELGLERTKMGDLLGWHVDQVGSDLILPYFSSQLADDGRPCLVMDFETEPKYADRDY